jgi:hypothetical protein
MRHDLSSVVVGFPKQLMSTARSPLSMPATMARVVRNMLVLADGAGTKRNGVVAVGDGLDSEIVAVMSYQAAGGLQLMVATDAGKIYRLEGGDWVEVWSGLDPAGTIRTVTFGGRLLLCNGIDEVLAWDGSAWAAVCTLVQEQAAGLTYVNGTTFRVLGDPAFYPAGSVVKAELGSPTTTVQAHVVSATLVGTTLTVVLDASVLTGALSKVYFTVKPPKVAYLAAVHDRLWGFGKGPLSAAMSGDVDRLRVFYTYSPNDFTAWPDPETGVVPSLNLADKAGMADELLAMAVKDGMTVFVGRNQMQLWTGTDPSGEGDLAWSKTIPLGVVHGNAVLELPNDLLFVTRQGARTLSRTLQTEQLDVSDVGAELDPTWTELLAVVMADDTLYRKVCGMRHDGQGWFGISLFDRTLVWQIGGFGHGWVEFDGVFNGVSAAHTAPDGMLYVAKGGQIYRYDTQAWSDAGEAITTVWWLPWLAVGEKRRWANKYVELMVEPHVAMGLTVRRYVDYDEANPRVVEVTAPGEPDYWDLAEWDEAAWDKGQAVAPLIRDHVVAETLSFAVESVGVDGPLTLFGLKLYGVNEK